MAAFATASDLATYMQRDLSAADAATAEMLLEFATDAIRNYTGQTISLVSNDTITLDPPCGSRLFLPQLPVTAVASVTVDGTLYVPTTDYHVYGNEGIVRLVGRSWGLILRSVVVVYSHGYATIPDDIKAVCLAAAKRQMANPEGNTETVVNMGPASVRQTFQDSVPRLQTLFTDGEQEVLRRYRPLVVA